MGVLGPLGASKFKAIVLASTPNCQHAEKNLPIKKNFLL
jgi:hypothetical protein